MIEALRQIMEPDTAGDPVKGCKWTRKTTGKVADELKRYGIDVSANTVGRLLKGMNFKLRANRKNLESGLRNPPRRKVRDRQFRHIRRQQRLCERKRIPMISVDTKHRELVGQYHHAGRIWCETATEVFDHDFPSDAKGVALPYGIHDMLNNEGFVCVGTSYDTPQFAVDAIGIWWLRRGQKCFQDAEEIFILADCGGSNGYRARLWKHQLQSAFCDRFGIKATICHYPPGSSKWNPVEHRLFSHISRNWAGQPLQSYETVLNFIRTTSTSTGLRVKAHLVSKKYQRGIKISDRQMGQLQISHHNVLPDWNYSIVPRKT